MKKLKRNEYYKEWREKNRERLALYKYNWYLAHKQQVIDRARKWNNEHPEWRLAYEKIYGKLPKRRKYINDWRRDKYKGDRLWRENKLQLNNKYFDKAHYNGFWKKCLERDDYTCQKCSGKNNLHVHHLRYGDDIGLEDLTTLCVSCHLGLHAQERKLRK